MAAKYADHPQEMVFGYYIDWHFKHGFVFSTPDFFIMGRAAPKGVIEADGVKLTWFPEWWNCDTWYIHAMSGDMSKAWSILPWELPWIAFERVRCGKRELTFIETGRLRRLTMQTTQEAVA
jgi:hypothetical protein